MAFPASRSTVPSRAAFLCACVIVAATLWSARPASQAGTYVIHTSRGSQPLPFRTIGGADYVALEPLAALFNLTLAEDAMVGGLTLRGPGPAILLIPGQSFASIGPGRIESLPGPVRQEGDSWQVPVEFIRQALGQALNLRVDIRRASRLILVGDVRLPQVTSRFQAQGGSGRLFLEFQPPAPYRVSREGSRLLVRFDAVGVELVPPAGLDPNLAAGIRADGPTLVVELGAGVASYRVTDSDDSRLTIDLLGAGAAALPAPDAPPATAAPAPPGPVAPDPPVLDPGGTGIRTIVIDPGHGGDDAGARGAGGMTEKDFVLQVARRLKAAIEGRIGLRVLLTRDGDEDVPLDRRTALANNNKADVFISLHVNSSVRPAASGAQVLSLNLDDYRDRLSLGASTEVPVPMLGGGTRTIDVVPWEVAQIPYASTSAALGAILARHLSQRGVPMYRRPTARLPLRTLVGANMPAVLLEMGFLSNPADARALGGAERSSQIIEAIVATIAEVRRGVPLTAAAGAAP